SGSATGRRASRRVRVSGTRRKRRNLAGSSRGDPGHLAALLGAGAARLRAAPAGVVVGLLALLRAGVAGLGAEPAPIVDEARAAAHEGGGHPAEGGAVTVQADALGQVGHVGLAQAGVGAVVALLGAARTGLDARAVSLMAHGSLRVRSGTGARQQTFM